MDSRTINNTEHDEDQQDAMEVDGVLDVAPQDRSTREPPAFDENTERPRQRRRYHVTVEDDEIRDSADDEVEVLEAVPPRMSDLSIETPPQSTTPPGEPVTMRDPEPGSPIINTIPLPDVPPPPPMLNPVMEAARRLTTTPDATNDQMQADLALLAPYIAAQAMAAAFPGQGRPPGGPTQGNGPPQPNTQDGQAPGQNNNANGPPPPPLPPFFFGLPPFMFGGNSELPADPKRAERLAGGLNVVEEGLLKRWKAVCGNEGAVCAVCYGELLEEPGIEKEKEEEEDKVEDKAPEAQEPKSDNTDEHERLIREALKRREEMEKLEEQERALKLETAVLAFPCGHVFHRTCLLPWLSRHTTCPTCRFDIDPKSDTLVLPAEDELPPFPFMGGPNGPNFSDYFTVGPVLRVPRSHIPGLGPRRGRSTGGAAPAQADQLGEDNQEGEAANGGSDGQQTPTGGRGIAELFDALLGSILAAGAGAGAGVGGPPRPLRPQREGANTGQERGGANPEAAAAMPPLVPIGTPARPSAPEVPLPASPPVQAPPAPPPIPSPIHFPVPSVSAPAPPGPAPSMPIPSPAPSMPPPPPSWLGSSSTTPSSASTPTPSTSSTPSTSTTTTTPYPEIQARTLDYDRPMAMFGRPSPRRPPQPITPAWMRPPRPANAPALRVVPNDPAPAPRAVSTPVTSTPAASSSTPTPRSVSGSAPSPAPAPAARPTPRPASGNSSSPIAGLGQLRAIVSNLIPRRLSRERPSNASTESVSRATDSPTTPRGVTSPTASSRGVTSPTSSRGVTSPIFSPREGGLRAMLHGPASLLRDLTGPSASRNNNTDDMPALESDSETLSEDDAHQSDEESEPDDLPPLEPIDERTRGGRRPAPEPEPEPEPEPAPTPAPPPIDNIITLRIDLGHADGRDETIIVPLLFNPLGRGEQRPANGEPNRAGNGNGNEQNRTGNEQTRQGNNEQAHPANEQTQARPAEPPRRARTPPPPKKWTPPEPIKTFRQVVEEKEREAGWRCDDPACLLGPADDEEPSDEHTIKPTYSIMRSIGPDEPAKFIIEDGIRVYADGEDVRVKGENPVCAHKLHPECLVTSARVNGWGDHEKDSKRVTLRCPVCRLEGTVERQVWETGVQAEE